MRNTKYFGLVIAAAIYAGFAVYLYQPYFKSFDVLCYLILLNACLGALGCYVISRRWVGTFAGSFFSGAIYGFGPFTLGIAAFHPAAGFPVAVMPWLFWPAVFLHKTRPRWLVVLLCALPFLAVFLFFWLSAWFRVFTIPVGDTAKLADLVGFFSPFVAAKRNATIIGVYHVPMAPLIIGISMLFTHRRLGIIMILVSGTGLAFSKSFLYVNPIIWLAIPVLCLAVLAGAGTQALVYSSFADRKWVATVAIIMGVLSVTALLFAIKCQKLPVFGPGYAEAFLRTAALYGLGAIAVFIIFVLVWVKVRVLWLRWAVLCAAMTVDIFISAGEIACRLF